jgi:3-hydroxybutyryl-CoA dehydrogenase
MNLSAMQNLPKVLGVLGAGQMGAGISQVSAQSGFQVVMVDRDRAVAEKSREKIRTQMGKLVEKGKLTSDVVTATLERIQVGDSLSAFGSCDLVIEAVTENPALKFQIFRDLDQATPKNAILATNTSSISVTQIAAQTSRPEKVMGMHFMNPVPVMKLVEGIRGLQTSEETFQMVKSTALAMGKVFVGVKDMPGFAVNRILMPMINEAVYVLHEGIATVEEIDQAMMLGTNQPMGPLTLADFIGLDTCLAIMEVLHEGLGDTKYRPCPLLRQYVQAGWLGRKSGKGFYTYAK